MWLEIHWRAIFKEKQKTEDLYGFFPNIADLGYRNHILTLFLLYTGVKKKHFSNKLEKRIVCK